MYSPGILLRAIRIKKKSPFTLQLSKLVYYFYGGLVTNR